MTKTLILIALLVLIYLYWKYQSTKILPPKIDDIIERKGKQKEQSPDDFNKSSEIFWDAQDFELSDDESTNSDHD